MANAAHEPGKRAMSPIRSSVPTRKPAAGVRAGTGLRDEVSMLNDARREGREEVARGMILKAELGDMAIADIAQISQDEVPHLRADIHLWES